MLPYRSAFEDLTVRLQRHNTRRFRRIAVAVMLLSGGGVGGHGLIAATLYDTVIANGRVMDPESGLDAVRHVGIHEGKVVAISITPLIGQRLLDATGLVVAPGFIDLHSHAQTIPSQRVQAFDGVTTALELELGNLPVGSAYALAAKEGRPINYGYSVSWAMARMKVLDGVAIDGDPATYISNYGKPKWNQLATRAQSAAVLAEVEQGLKDGGIGIGIMAGYAPASNRDEYVGLARLASRYHVPTFTHIRHTNREEPGGAYEGFAEVIAAALSTGAHMHICHINSSSWRQIATTTAFIEKAQRAGLRVTTEAYPYGASSTTIGAPGYRPENLPRAGLKSTDIYVVDLARWVKDDEDLVQIRKDKPQAIGVYHYLDDQNLQDRALIQQALLFPGTAIASDAVPYAIGGQPVQGDVWPIPDNANAHPRVAGTFARVMGVWVRERKVLSLMEALRRATLIPATILEEAVPMMKNKGRISVGADADIVVFDPQTITDKATFENPRQPSVGMRYVLVGGVPLINNSELVRDVLPGKPVLGERR